MYIKEFEDNMEKKIKELTVSEFQNLIDDSMKKAFGDIAEDILALSNPGYIDSIKEARRDYKEGRTKSFDEVFNV